MNFARSDMPVMAQGWLFGRPDPSRELHRIPVQDAINPIEMEHCEDIAASAA